MSSESKSDVKTPKKRKRGVLNPDTYQRNVIKKSRVQGKEYVTYKGKTITQKTPPHDIHCKCPAKCFKLVTKKVLTEIWNKFYSMESKNAQDRYLQALIWRKEVRRRRKPKLTLPIEHPCDPRKSELTDPFKHHDNHSKSKSTVPIEHHDDDRKSKLSLRIEHSHDLKKSKSIVPIEHHDNHSKSKSTVPIEHLDDQRNSKSTVLIEHHDDQRNSKSSVPIEHLDDQRNSKSTVPIEHHDDHRNSKSSVLIEHHDVQRESKLTVPTKHYDEAKLTDRELPFPTTQELTDQQHCKRGHTFLYNLQISGVYQRVCKNVFMSTHGIKADRIRRLCSLLLARQISEDRRGKCRSGNAISDEICAKIHEHIDSFEVKKALFGRKITKYLDARLNILKMHQMFVKDHPDLESKVKYSFYYNYFKENFGYAFGPPPVDIYNQSENFESFLKLPSCLKKEEETI